LEWPVASAIFGILRQTTSTSLGLDYSVPLNGGYGQFIKQEPFRVSDGNGLGLTLGMILGGVVNASRRLIYFARYCPFGPPSSCRVHEAPLIAMLAQVISAVLLF